MFPFPTFVPSSQVAAPASIEYTGQFENISLANPTTSGTIGIGAAAADRRVFLLVFWGLETNNSAGGSLVSATIAGIAATIHVQKSRAGSSTRGSLGCAIISAAVPTGTTANVSVTMNTTTFVRISSFRVTGLQSAVADDTDSYATDASNLYEVSLNLNVQDGGIQIVAMSERSASSVSFNNVTKRHDVLIGTAIRHLGGSNNVSVTQLRNLAAVSGGGGGPFFTTFVGASFR